MGMNNENKGNYFTLNCQLIIEIPDTLIETIKHSLTDEFPSASFINPGDVTDASSKFKKNFKKNSIDEYPDILTPQDIANYLKISRRRVYELTNLKPEHGGISSFMIGSSRRVKKTDLINWIDSLKMLSKGSD